MLNLNIHPRINANIVPDGRRNIKLTPAYKLKVEKIKEDLNLKYRELIRREKSVFKKSVMFVQLHLEIKKEINKLTSLDKMFLKLKV